MSGCGGSERRARNCVRCTDWLNSPSGRGRAPGKALAGVRESPLGPQGRRRTRVEFVLSANRETTPDPVSAARRKHERSEAMSTPWRSASPQSAENQSVPQNVPFSRLRWTLLSASASPSPTARRRHPVGSSGLPVAAQRVSAHDRVCDSAASKGSLRGTLHCVWPSPPQHRVGTPSEIISELEYLACAFLCQRLTGGVTVAGA